MTGTRKQSHDWHARPLSDLERRELALEAADAERRRGDAAERLKSKDGTPPAVPGQPAPRRKPA